jgi:hypothetical protein
MTLHSKSVVAQIHRHGRTAEVLDRQEIGRNDFGNTIDEHVIDREVIAFRTYPNRNTESQTSAGDRQQDRPIFLVPIGEDQPEPPQPEAHIVYAGQEYEVKAHTPYDTHVEFPGAPVIHPDDGF